jgi:hypothetical protein
MGVQLINEGWDDIIKAILGISDDGGKKITQDIGDDVSKLSSELSRIGGNSLSDVTSYLSKQGLNTDDSIINWIKGQPEIIDQMAKSSDQIMKQAIENVYANLKSNQIIPQGELEYLGDILSYGIEDPRLSLSELTNYVSELRRIQDGKISDNPYLGDLIKQLDDKIKLKETHLANKSKTSTQTSTPTSSAKGTTESSVEDFTNTVNRVFDEQSEDEILGQTETFDDFIGKLIPEKLPKIIDRDKLIAEIRERTAKISSSNVEESERIFRDVYTTSEKQAFIAKSMKSLKASEEQINNVLGNDSSYFKWFSRGNEGLNKIAKKDLSWYKKFALFVWKNYRYTVIFCGIYEAFKLTETYDKQSLSDTGKQAGLGAAYCGLAGLAWPAILAYDGYKGIKDMTNIGQYSNDAEGWKEWIEDNTKELGIVDYGFDTTENKRYINLSNDDQKFVNYDTESETFITEN